MARQERPVDPTAGPLQSFAYELRKVRAEAGNPTYRALARAAGYSATTLSEAASGLRKPSLEVVLAYVGACNGDADAWRQRWHELESALSDSRPGEAVPPTPDQPRRAEDPQAATSDDVAPQVPGDPAPRTPGDPAPHKPRAWWRRGTTIAAAVAGVVVVGLVVGVLRWPSDAQPAGAPSCPKVQSRPAFTGVTYGAGARVRSGASRDQPVVFTIPVNCTVGFDGFCLGQKVHDSTGSAPDLRWFKLGDGNVVSSAVIHGNPPTALKPSRCDHDRPGPDAVTLSVSLDPAQPGGLTLEANGSNVDLVGFAASYAPASDQTSGRRWHQVAFTETTGSRSSTVLRGDQLGNVRPDGQVVVAAAACLGGEGPTDVVDVKAVRTDSPTGPGQPVTLDQRDIDAAARSACQYPGRN